MHTLGENEGSGEKLRLGMGVVHVYYYLGTGPKAFISVVPRLGKGPGIFISLADSIPPK